MKKLETLCHQIFLKKKQKLGIYNLKKNAQILKHHQAMATRVPNVLFPYLFIIIYRIKYLRKKHFVLLLRKTTF
jgi:hypothetical protein